MLSKSATLALMLALVSLSTASSLQVREAEAEAEPANGQRTQAAIQALPGGIAGIAQLIQAIRAPGAAPTGNAPPLRRRAVTPGGDRGASPRTGGHAYTLNDVRKGSLLDAPAGTSPSPPIPKRDLSDIELLDLLGPALVARDVAAERARSAAAVALDTPVWDVPIAKPRLVTHKPGPVQRSKGPVPRDLGALRALLRRGPNADTDAESEAEADAEPESEAEIEL